MPPYSYNSDKQRPAKVSFVRIGVVIVAAVFFVLYASELKHHLGAARDGAYSKIHPGGQQQQNLQSSSSWSTADIDSSSQRFSLPQATLQWFPQARRCSTQWMQQYSDLHADILSGKLPPRHFMSVAVEAGVADRLSGMITQFWLAVLTNRAFTAATYGDVPGFQAVCDAPHLKWTTPAAVPDEAIEPLKFTYKGVRGFPAENRSLPGNLDPQEYQMLYLVNGRNLTFFQQNNVSSIFDPPEPAYVISASNRGRTYALANNPYHRQQFWEYGVPPTDIFMCGFFYLCSPVAAIQSYYQKFWEALQEPGVLKIGIQIRTGDKVFNKGETDTRPDEEILQPAAEWFDCAEKVQNAYALPGQKVIWYLNSDSQQLRKAAKSKYGDKLITDDQLQMTHPDCFQGQAAGGKNISNECEQAAMNEALQHSLGAMLTFSMTDYHVISKPSGFGRLGAWLSGRWGNIYQVVRGQGTCAPSKPVPPEQSAFHWAGV